MKLKNSISVLFFAFCLVSVVFVSRSFADRMGNGSDINDCLQIGEITKIGNRELVITTKFEKAPKTYTLTMHPDAYVHTGDRGQFMKFSELKTGNLVAAYGWYRDGKWWARRIAVMDPNDYLMKRLADDAKAGVYYKGER
jgi:hypothetical protein